MKIEWMDQMSTGVPEIDEQHKKLIAEIVRLGTAMEQGKGKDELMQSLQFTDSYIKEHFKYEENCFFIHQCPYANRNKLEHENFIKRFEVLKAELEDKGTSSTL